jgi:hypothetical protein
MTTNCKQAGITKPAELPAQMQADTQSAGAGSESSPGNATANPQAPASANAEWCLLVVPDGDPKLELFADLAGLKARLRELDEQGGTVNAFPFYGNPMAFTNGPYRFLYLPDGQIQPLFDFEPYGRFIAHPGAQPPIDRRFYLGPQDEDVPDAIVDRRQPTEAPHAKSKRQQEWKALPAEPSDVPVEVETALPEPCMAAVASD